MGMNREELNIDEQEYIKRVQKLLKEEENKINKDLIKIAISLTGRSIAKAILKDYKSIELLYKNTPGINCGGMGCMALCQDSETVDQNANKEPREYLDKIMIGLGSSPAIQKMVVMGWTNSEFLKKSVVLFNVQETINILGLERVKEIEKNMVTVSSAATTTSEQWMRAFERQFGCKENPERTPRYSPYQKKNKRAYYDRHIRSS
jgi:hypothetical protein